MIHEHESSKDGRIDTLLGASSGDDASPEFDTEYAAALYARIEARTAVVGIVGLGYVGLPLAWTFHEGGFPVLGFDVDESKIRHISNGTSYIKHVGEDMMGKLAASNRCDATADFDRVPEADVILLCVPTPLDEHREPDMSYVKGTLKAIGPHLRPGQLIVLESTTYPGTTEELVKPLCEELSGLTSGQDIFVAYSPEREDPGNPSFRTATIPKVVGADGRDALVLSNSLYSSVIVETVPVSSTRTAEAVKLLENIFRSVNIALVNELKEVFHEMGIDIFEVVDAAKTKPFGYMPFYPGPGLGGHCIPIDPFYLTWKAREYGVHTRFIELAGEINTRMPNYVVKRCMEALNEQGKALKGSKVICVGLAYKPDVDDDRESPTYVIMDLLKKYGADVSYYDPHVPVIKPSREHSHWAGTTSTGWTKDEISSFDLTLVLTDHSEIDYAELHAWSQCVVDTRDVMRRNGLRGSWKVWRS